MTINIPSSWKDIKLSQFEAALLVEQTEYEDAIDQQVEWIAALTGATIEKIEQLPFSELADISVKLKWVKEPKFDERIPRFFTIGSKMFEVVYQIDQLTAAQYAELCTWMKVDPMLNLDKAMASITIRRKYWLLKGKYDGATHEARAKLFRKHLSLAVIYPIALFFSQVFTRLMLDMQDFSVKELIKLRKQMTMELKQILKEQRKQEEDF